jgi:hypothetical protein
MWTGVVLVTGYSGSVQYEIKVSVVGVSDDRRSSIVYETRNAAVVQARENATAMVATITDRLQELLAELVATGDCVAPFNSRFGRGPGSMNGIPNLE